MNRSVMFSLKSVECQAWIAELSNDQTYSDIVLTTGSGSEVQIQKPLLASMSSALYSAMQDLPGHPHPLVIIPDVNEESLTMLGQFFHSEELTFDSMSSYDSLLELLHLLDVDYVDKCYMIERGTGGPEVHDSGAGHDDTEYDETENLSGDSEIHDISNAISGELAEHSFNFESSLVKREPHLPSVASVKREAVHIDRSLLVKREANHVPSDLTSQSQSGEFADVIHSCSFCEKCFASSVHLDKHVKNKHSHGKFQCELCSSTFVSMASRARHVNSVHNKQKFQCDICLKDFTQKCHVETHRAMVHFKERPFACSTCEKSFPRRDYLEDHLKTHTGEKPYCCAKCGKGYAHKSSKHQHESYCLLSV